MVMLALAGVNAFVFHQTVFRWVEEWDLAPSIPRRAKLAGASSLVVVGRGGRLRPDAGLQLVRLIGGIVSNGSIAFLSVV